jgi:hypothetical protein
MSGLTGGQAATVPASGGSATSATALPFTGADTVLLAEIAGGLLVLGGGLVLAGRRRAAHAQL